MMQYYKWGDPITKTEQLPTDTTPPNEPEEQPNDTPVIIGEWNLTDATEYAA